MFGEVRIVDDVPAAFAELVVDEAPESVALSGGSLARRCYEALDVDWRTITVFIGDERVVPADHPDSNEGMVRRVLHPNVVHSMVGLGADAYDELVRSVPPIELVHLGMGPDGHTASLFPGAPQLAHQQGREAGGRPLHQGVVPGRDHGPPLELPHGVRGRGGDHGCLLIMVVLLMITA